MILHQESSGFVIGLKLWWPDGAFNTATGCAYSDAGRAFRRRIPEFVRHFQGTEQGRDCVFAYSAPMFGQRDSVGIAGDYVLTEAALAVSNGNNQRRVSATAIRAALLAAAPADEQLRSRLTPDAEA